ncbi:fasciclin domain-containing protein [Seonamhaeicola sp. MEBiC1930]|uniref:fasciclin domain-containing protein n=1 Tax=Seonamhaeicola sp. MEBiC01930 TaxID=2976768 RepID=UPI00324E3279
MKEHIMKNRTNTIFNFGRLLMIAGLLITYSCKDDAWDAHYEQLDSRLETNILSILSEDPDYSIFVNYLYQTGLNEALETAQAYTVWAPNNAAFGQVSSDIVNDPDLLKALIGNHISLFSFNTANNEQTFVKMFNDKYVEFLNSNTASSFGGIDILEKDILASNGIIHTMNEVLEVSPNIWGYLNENEDQFPTLMTFLNQFNETGFDEANSVKTGTNTLGQTVYDSVFKSTNTYFKTIGDLSSEEERFTFIGLTENIYAEVYDDLDDYYRVFPVDSTKSNTDKAIFRNLNYPFVNSNDLGMTSITSTTGGEVVIDPSDIAEDVSLSNGNLLLLNDLTFDPVGLIYKPIRFEVENNDIRTIGSLTDFSIQKKYDAFASGQFTNVIRLLENPDATESNNYFELNFSNVLAASYNLNLKFTPVGASQDTKLRFELRLIAPNFRPTLVRIPAIVVSNLEDGVVTIGDVINNSFYVNGLEGNYFFMNLRIYVDVSEPELLLYDRHFGLDYVELVPTE